MPDASRLTPRAIPVGPSDCVLRSTDQKAMWNFVGGPAEMTLTFDGEIAVATDSTGGEHLRTPDPFAALVWMERYNRSSGANARWVGYISYEFARFVERLPHRAVDDLQLPLFVFQFRHTDSQSSLVSWNEEADPIRLTKRSMTRAAHLAATGRALDYIAAGDIFQVNLAQRLTLEPTNPAGRVWEKLATSMYGAYLHYGKYSIVSNSPELFFRIEPQRDGARRIVNRPIKGTRPLLPGMRAELEASIKDRAELAMIVDLQRNDLGRVCDIGSVVVRESRVIEAHAGVYHGVATIDGTLRKGMAFADVIRALFPCGSVTGCPKIRAMEIIDELEPVARGPYCGAIGYLAADGSAEFNVAIRTMVVKDRVASVYVGGGIVADSTPQGEYDETIVKAQAMLAALGVSEAELRRIADGNPIE